MKRKPFIYIVNRMLAVEFYILIKTRAALLSWQDSVGNLLAKCTFRLIFCVLCLL